MKRKGDPEKWKRKRQGNGGLIRPKFVICIYEDVITTAIKMSS